MSVTLNDLLALPALAGARLTPSGTDTDLEIDGIAPPSAGELPAGSWLVIDGDERATTAAGCAAVLRRGRVPEGTAMPTITLPEDADWTATLGSLAEALAGPGNLAVARQARESFRELATVDATATDVAERAEQLLGAPIAILDEYLDVLGLSGVSLEQRSELGEAVERARRHGPVSLVGVMLRDDVLGTHRQAVSAGRDPVGLVVVWTASPTPSQEAVLAELDSAVLGMRSRDAVRLETESRLRGDFIEELSSGDPLPAELVVRRARHLGADLSNGAIAISGALQDPHNLGRRITDRRLVRRFLQRMRSVISMNRGAALVDWRDDSLLVLLPPPRQVPDGAEQDVEDESQELGQRMIAATADTVSGLALTLALSRYTRDPARLGTAIEESRLAFSIGERLGRVGELITFEETGAYKLLFRVLAERPSELEAFYEETLAPIVAYDAQNQTDLLATLVAYLDNDGNLANTAAQLFTHRHTVRYRLDRIADVAGLDVATTDDREMLSLGLKAMRLLGRPLPDTRGAAAESAASA
jgi:sugar diacid utilization regulator